jgi:hypothetical protein
MRVVGLESGEVRQFPPCPFGHAGEIRSRGFRTIKGSSFARPMFRCVHHPCDAHCRRNCDGTHTFTQGSQARTKDHPAGTHCGECDRERTLRDGQSIAVAWDFEARLIADALISVGKGMSYRKAAQEMRDSALRYELRNGVKIISKWGNSVHRYLDHFGALVLEGTEHKEWPEVLVLDALPWRKRTEVEDDPYSFEQSGSGAILVAVGYTDPSEKRRRRKRNEFGILEDQKAKITRDPHVWKIALTGGYNRFAWFDFLSSLPGTPRWIVADEDSAVRIAARWRWGDGPDAPIVFSCEGHFQRKFQERADKKDRLPGIDVERLWPKSKPGVPLAERPRGPLWTPDDYRALLDAVLAYEPSKVASITGWLLDHDEVVHRQFEIRAAHRGEALPRSNAAVEAVIADLKLALGRRTKVIQNVYRTNIMLGLIHARLGNHTSVDSYAKVIRRELEDSRGRPEINWRAHHYKGRVKSGQPGPKGSLFDLADHYQKLGEEDHRRYNVRKQASSMEKKLLEHNIYHFLNGYEPLTLTDGKTPSVRSSGKFLRDFPMIRREWDADWPANAQLDPDTINAGHYKFEVGWVCHEDPSHRWRQTISERCQRLLGCPECLRLRRKAGIAVKDRRPLHVRLASVRAGWGEYEKTPVPVPQHETA